MRRLGGKFTDWRWEGTAIGLCLLILLTLALSHATWRYQIVAEKVFNNLDFSQGGSGWAASGNRIQVYPGPPTIVALNAQGAGQNVLLSRPLPAASKQYPALRIQAELSSQGIEAGAAHWQRGRLILLSLDASGKRIWYWPQHVASLKGTQSWRRYEHVIPLNHNAVQTWLVIYVSAASGKLLMKNLHVQAVAETVPYRLSLKLLGIAWLIFGIWIVASLTTQIRTNPATALSVFYAVAILAGGIAPQPQLRDTLRGVYQFVDRLATVEEVSHSAENQPAKKSSAIVHEAAPKTKKTTPAMPARASQPQTPAMARQTTNNYHLTALLRSGGSDKRLHLFAFAGLSLLLVITFRRYPPYRSVLSAILLGAAIEALQALSITREPEWGDIGFDSAGVLLGAGVGIIILKLFKQHPHGTSTAGIE